jgi:hypothetical protein
MCRSAPKSSVASRASSWLALLLVAGCGRVGVSLVVLNHARPDSDSGALDAAADGGDDDAVYAGDAAMMSVDGSTPVDANRDAALGCNAASFVPDASCGTGYCRSTNTPSKCSNGVESACIAGTRLSATDSSCDAVDDDCDGESDEEYSGASTRCGSGVCMRTGATTCVMGHETDSCMPAMPSTSTDGPPINGADDDCDGRIDEDACDTTPRKLGPGAYANLSVPAGCYSVTVQLWGGGGASGGKSVPWSAGNGGRGGAGGYASSLLTISGALTLYVGQGGASGCNAGGANSGSNTYAGGSGASGNGDDGAGGTAAVGGAGGNTSAGGDGGRGHYGGGGGGQGAQAQAWDPPGGAGGGGGAASVFLMDGVITLAAGGGGGSGGEAGGWWGVASGGSGGEGCGSQGGVGTQAECGAGGGGGVCVGMTTHAGTEGVPYSGGASLPAGQAEGATDNCGAGGGGYAVITFGK